MARWKTKQRCALTGFWFLVIVNYVQSVEILFHTTLVNIDKLQVRIEWKIVLVQVLTVLVRIQSFFMQDRSFSRSISIILI